MKSGYAQIRGRISCRRNTRNCVLCTSSRAISSKHAEIYSNKHRTKTYADDTLDLVRRYLKDDAVPSVFPNTPNYLSNSHGGTTRSTKRATASSHREQLMQKFDNLSDTFMSEDNISHLDLTEIQDRLRAESALPSGFTRDVRQCNVPAHLQVAVIKRRHSADYGLHYSAI